MAEGTRSSKNVNDDATIGPAPNCTGEIRLQPDGRNQPVSNVPISGEAAPVGSGVKAGRMVELSSSQHAQITHHALGQGLIGVALVGPDSRIEMVNEALASLLGFSQEELTGKMLDSFVRAAGHKQNPITGTEASPNEGPEPMAVRSLAGKSGDTIACHIDSRAIHDENGKATHFLVFVSAALPGKRTEETSGFEKELYNAEALQTLGMLAGGVAHDFNNALEVIIGFATLARIRLSAADPLHEPLRIIEESAKGAADLTRQLLDVSRNDADDEGAVDAGHLVGVVLSIVTRTFDRKIRIEPRLAERLPSINVNRSRLQQAILNLCINARDAMQKGGTLFIKSALQTLKPGDAHLPASKAAGPYVCISIRDTGEGMSAEVMKNIFVPRFTTKGRGNGLGLAMVDRIVKEAQGFISVSSQPGKGSEFSLYLPAVFDKQPRGANSTPDRMIAGRGRVLVVDDEPRVLEFLEKGLTRLGYKVVTAENGSRACEIFSRKSDGFNCVLLDLIMPGMGGLETYARLKAIDPAVRVILSSGYSSGRVRREAMEAGGPEFLEKPFTLEVLSQALQKIQQN